jgi:hypothetical protein
LRRARGGEKVLYRERKRIYDQNFHGNGNQNGIIFILFSWIKKGTRK